MVCGFIELTDRSGYRAAIDIGSIRMINEEATGCMFRFKNLSGTTFPDGQERFPTGLFHAKESYDVVKAKIMKVFDND